MLRVIGVAILLLSLTACANEAETIAFPYAAPTPVPAASGHLPFEVAVVDRRARQDRISSKLDAHGGEHAPISSSEPIDQVINRALAAELQARGFVRGQQGAHIEVNVLAFYTRFNQHHDQLFKQNTADAVVRLDVAVTRKSRVLYSREVSARGSIRAPTQRYWGGTAASVLSDALRRAITDVVDDPAFRRAMVSRQS